MSGSRFVTVLAAALLLAGCGQADTGDPGDNEPTTGAPADVVIQAGRVSGLGDLLTDGEGHTLYMYEPDQRERVTCVDDCPLTWPPAVVPSGTDPVAGPGADQDLLGSLPGPDGQPVVTYHGWPLYRFVGDTATGTANGQGLDDGGLWYVLDPSGTPVHTPLGE